MSKFLSLILRHEPESVGLKLDEAGWTDVEALLSACQTHGRPYTWEDLKQVVATNEKKRFAFSEDGRRIRASQGHSVEVDLGYAPQSPPARLLHGTPSRFLDSIRVGGLHKGERHHVHLSTDETTAYKVGQRRGDSQLLVVDAAAMAAQGHQFFVSANGVWLTDHVPAEFIQFPRQGPSESTKHVGKRSSRAHMAKETLGICEAGSYTTPRGVVVDLAAAIREAKSMTRVHDLDRMPSVPVVARHKDTKISVTAESTIAALRRLDAEPGGHLACLNFASAKNPGGGFLGGSEAQEESLARSSTLYPCLLAAPEFYERNRECRTALYFDLAIWSPGVSFFRDDEGSLLAESVTASVITAPAPNAGAVADNTPEQSPLVLPTLQRRAEFVLSIAAEHQVRRLVLGAWGCGVFRNDPRLVAETFATLLSTSGKFVGVFEEVVFAIYDRTGKVLQAFRDAFPS